MADKVLDRVTDPAKQEEPDAEPQQRSAATHTRDLKLNRPADPGGRSRCRSSARHAPPFDPQPAVRPGPVPGIGPKNPQVRQYAAPLDNEGRPFDPRAALIDQPAEDRPGAIDSVPIGRWSADGPPRSPNIGQPLDPPPDGKRKFDPDNPLGVPNDPPDKIARRGRGAATACGEERRPSRISAVKRLSRLVSDGEAMNA